MSTSAAYLGNLSGRVDVPFRDELIERLHFDPSLRARSYAKGNRQKLALIAGSERAGPGTIPTAGTIGAVP